MELMKRNFNQRGQALLAIILVMVVGLTVGLSLVSRSVTDIQTATQIEGSSRAFSAAEAGIESVLKNSSDTSGCPSSGNCFNVVTSLAGGTDAPLQVGEVGIGDTYNLWLVWHKQVGSDWVPDLSNPYLGTDITVCWQKVNLADPDPAIEAAVFYQNLPNYGVWRGAYDPNIARTPANKFTDVSGSLGSCPGYSGYYLATINLVPPTIPAGTKIALRLRPFYAKANVVVIPQSGNSLPTQGLAISSTGTAGGVSRKVSVIQSYPALSPVFDYVLFSGKDVCKGNPPLYTCP